MPAAAKKRTSSTAGTAKRHSNAIDKQLARYRSMRDFKITAEPTGASRPKRAAEKDRLPFVIQKHAATRLHYDFRLGLHGVLKSWAVTKGPSYYTGDRRLAVQVEDHPMEYGGFEGIIPKGQYGGGTVMLWDEGTWEPHGDADEGLAKGRLKFALYGKKLHGNWTLIRMNGKAAGEKKSNWLLIKEHDEYERGPGDSCITEEEPNSVVTGRDLEAIAKNQDHVWGSGGSHKPTAGEKKSAANKKKEPERFRAARPGTVKSRTSKITAALRVLPKERLPEFVTPQLAIQVEEAPEGGEWLHELKLDGYRIQARIDRGKNRSGPVQLITRGGLDWTHRMPGIADVLTHLPVESALLDGEVVVFDEHGGTSFAMLQAAFQESKKQPLTYVVFDLLHLNGHNLRALPLIQRKDILKGLLDTLEDAETLHFSEHLVTRGKEIFEQACRLGAEGIVSKRADAPYTAGRHSAWLKIKCRRQQEFVIGGFTPPSGGGVAMGALLLGYYRGGELIYAGRTGTGYTQKMRRDLRARLDKIRQPKPPFVSLPPGAAHQAIWVEPKYVCEVQFATWTADNLVRQASFQGLREDKSPKEVTREVSMATQAVTGRSSAPEKASHARATANADHLQRAAKRVASAKSQKKTGEPFPIPLTHPDKQVDAETKLTKRELADYFWAVREHMLPFIVNRPLSVVRCPQGSTQPCFYQKHVAGNLPEGIEGIDIRGRRSGVVETYITISEPLGLAGLVQMGVLEIHPWGSTNKDIEKPNMLIFDLDPDEEIAWKVLAESARQVRKRLKHLKLESFLKTTGGKGLHIVAPIAPQHDWPVVKAFALGFATSMEADNPQLYLTKMTKAARKGKIYIDYLRNDRGATSIAPFSPRARHGAPVAATLDWKELDAPQRPRFLVADFAEWKDRLRHDPWKKMATVRQAISAEMLEEFTPGVKSGSHHSARKG